MNRLLKNQGADMTNLRISVGKPLMVSASEIRHYPPRPIIRAADGGLLLTVGVGEDATFQDITRPVTVLLRSDDNGETWYRVREFYAYTGHMLMGLPDGTVHAGSYWITYKECSGTFFVVFQKSTDNGRTFTGPHEAPINFPKDKLPLKDGKGTRVPGRTVAYAGWLGGGSLPVVFPNGRVLAPIDLTCGRERCAQGFVESRDNGESWSYVSSIPPDAEVKGEGYDEGGLTLTHSGKLVCVLRTGGDLPLYQSESTDEGMTWSKPHRLEALGVAPFLITLSSGVLACGYGRPGNNIMFSLDEGASWTGHTQISPDVWHGPGPSGEAHAVRGSMGYTSIIEVEPGKVLFMYDTLWVIERDERGDQGNLMRPADYIRSVEIDVELTG